MSTHVFNQAIRQRLNLPPHDSLPPSCEIYQCGTSLTNVDDKIHHHHSCTKMKRRQITARHDLVLNTVISLAKQAGYATEREPIEPDASGINKRPDAKFISSQANQPLVYVDVTISHPAANAHYKAAAKTELVTAEKRETQI